MSRVVVGCKVLVPSSNDAPQEKKSCTRGLTVLHVYCIVIVPEEEEEVESLWGQVRRQ